MLRRRLRDPFTKAVNWAIRSAMLLAPHSIIPDLIVACIVGDGEAETGPLATAWQSNKFLDPITDGAVLPILHLNGYKISNPTLLARIEPMNWSNFFAAAVGHLTLWKATSRKRCMNSWPRRWKKPLRTSGKSKRTRGTRKTRLVRAGR